MGSRLLYPLSWIIAATATPLGLFLYLKLHAVDDAMYAMPHGHFYVVTGAAFLAAVAALVVGVAGARRRNIHVTFLSMAFTSLALIFMLHGLATPGFLLPMTQVPAVAAQLSILTTAGWLYLSSCPTDHLLVRLLSKWQRQLMPAWAALLTVGVAAAMRFPGLVRFAPIQLSPLKWVATLVVMALAALTALRLGRAMGLPPEQLRALAQGGIIHDVGKIEVPDQILNKPGRLTDEERSVVERHPVTGYEVCKRLGFLTEELGIIRHHHEKWDGTGYPDRLQGAQIPLLARILAISDVYDALTSTNSTASPGATRRPPP